MDTSGVNLIDSGACGAFVHGLEDEMYGAYSTLEGSFSTLQYALWEYSSTDGPVWLVVFFVSFFFLHRSADCSRGGPVFPGPVLS